MTLLGDPGVWLAFLTLSALVEMLNIRVRRGRSAPVRLRKSLDE